MQRFSRIAKNAILGDGMVISFVNRASISFMSTDLKLLQYKEKLLDEEGFAVSRWGTQASGYGGTKTIHNISTKSHAKIKEASDVGVEALIKDLTKEDMYLWYLDDGSWHIKNNTMHLYSNMLNEEQSNLLIKRIGDLYGIDPRLRVDRKKDGRAFFYLYFPRELVKLFRPEVKEYVTAAGIDTMFYKFGGMDYEEKPSRYSVPVGFHKREYKEEHA